MAKRSHRWKDLLETRMARSSLEEANEALLAFGVRLEDMEEQFIRSSGPGGQHVNRTSTAVRLHHRASGVEVRCESERSQLQNRIIARELLLKKLKEKAEAERAAQIARREKLRRQRRRPSKAARAKNVERKRQRGNVKKLRKFSTSEE
jgi:protein subunit release factor B